MTEAREALAAALVAGIDGVNVYAAAPEAVKAPAVILLADDPWVRPLTWNKSEIRMKAVVLSVSGTNEAAVERLEATVWAAVSILRAAGALVGEVSSPTLTAYGAAEFAAVEIGLTVHVEDEEVV
jgi:hypothetical protein